MAGLNNYAVIVRNPTFVASTVCNAVHDLNVRNITKIGISGILIPMSSFFIYSKPFERLFLEHGERIQYAKEQRLIWGKDKSSWVFFLKSGFVCASFAHPQSTERIIGYFVPGHVFAQSGSFTGAHDGTLSYIAKTPSVAYRMRHAAFLRLVHEDTSLMKEYLAMTLRNQVFLIDRIVYQGEKGLYRKCVRWLLFMAKYYGKPVGNGCQIEIPLTQNTAAEFMHTTRESLNGILHQLADAKLISIARKQLTIRSITRLRKELI